MTHLSPRKPRGERERKEGWHKAWRLKSSVWLAVISTLVVSVWSCRVPRIITVHQYGSFVPVEVTVLL